LIRTTARDKIRAVTRVSPFFAAPSEEDPTMTRPCWIALATWALLVVPARAGVPRPLFNGKDLEGWVVEGHPGSDRLDDGRPVWTVDNGSIRCAGKGFGFLRYDRAEFADFTLHVAFRMAPKCNSGIGFRTRVFDPKKSHDTRPSYYSYELQLIDDGMPPSKTSNGSLYRYVAPREDPLKPAGAWNEIEITCVGPKIRVVLNGRTIQDVDQSTIEALKDKPRKGYVCLQNHGGRIEFRDVTIQELGAGQGGPTARPAPAGLDLGRRVGALRIDALPPHSARLLMCTPDR
jgi:hypothetical protein